MNLSFHIARRYLLAKKSHNAINIISMVSVCGVAITTMALICTLSVFNGFQVLIADLFTAFDPQLRITAVKGKTFIPDSATITAIRSIPSVEVISETLQERALVEYKERQVTATVKGVPDNYRRQVNMERLLQTGEFKLQEGETRYAMLGIGLAASLGCHSSAIYPLTVLAPKRKGRVNMANPSASFNSDYLYVSGIFTVNQPEYDEQYMLVPLDVARSLFDYPQEVSALELKLTDRADVQQTKAQINALPGVKDEFWVQDRYEQQEEAFRMTQIEKWITFLILTFILLIAAFNVVGSLSMLMIDKQADRQILRNLGATDHFIRRIFLYEGWLISATGALVGIVLGIGLCLLQEHFGLLSLGDTAGTFITDAYPVKLLWSDVLLVFAVVGIIGYLAAWFPTRKIIPSSTD